MKNVNRMTWAALAALAVAILVFAGGYHAGRDLAQRDSTRQAI